LRPFTLIAWLAGAALLAWLLVESNAGGILKGVAALGWWLAALLVFHAVTILVDVLAWRLLFAKSRPPVWRLFWIRWIGEGANGLLPVPQLGEFLRAKLARDRGSPGAEAAASVIADVTMALATQVLFTLIGLGLFSLGSGSGAIYRALAASLLLAFFAGAFYALQHFGLIGRAAAFLARRIGKAEHLFDLAGARRLDEMLKRVYGRPWVLAEAFAWRFAGWIIGAGEIVLVLYALGHPVGLSAAIQMESLSQAARVVAFLIPGGLGVQDGALLLVAGGLGITPGVALTLSVARRFRELALGLPALATGYAIEARGWASARAVKKEDSPQRHRDTEK
jgi:putative membrane protein